MAKKKTSKKATKKKRGRTKGDKNSVQHPATKLTKKIIDEMCAIVAKGNFRQVACQRMGITPGTYRTWTQAGRKQLREFEQGERTYLSMQAQLVIKLDEAEGYIHGQMVEDILNHGSIQARQWYLERRFNKLYTKNPNAHTDDETGETVTIDPIAVLAARLKELKDNDGGS